MVNNKIDIWLKKYVKDKKWYWLLVILTSIGSIYFGAFVNDSSFIRETNLFVKFFGKTLVDIDPTYNNIENGTQIILKIVNNGDKDIQDLYVNYDFCHTGLKTALIREPVLRVDNHQYFTIENVTLKTSCSPSLSATFGMYFDNDKRCYVKIRNPFSEVCGFCPIDIQAYGNGETKPIYNKTIGYPFSTLNTTTLSVLFKYNPNGINITLNQTRYPEYTTFNLYDCIDITNVENTSGLEYFDDIDITVFDPYTYCLQRSDPEWCAYFSTHFYREKSN